MKKKRVSITKADVMAFDDYDVAVMNRIAYKFGIPKTKRNMAALGYEILRQKKKDRAKYSKYALGSI